MSALKKAKFDKDHYLLSEYPVRFVHEALLRSEQSLIAWTRIGSTLGFPRLSSLGAELAH